MSDASSRPPFVADLHIHSRFSRATSRSLDLPTLHRTAQLKGVRVVGTGDATHPGWRAELVEQLVPAEPGLFALRPDLVANAEAGVPGSCRRPVRFLLSGEIANIYKRDGRTRKVHNLVCLPTFAALERLVERLERIGNLRSDGRPILGLDSRDLLQEVLEADEAAFLIPAHVWTPWFSALGSKSGFDSIEACYGDLAGHIFAVETGLSSDPPMNWRVSSLDRYTLVSSSDAHSADRLGREATVFRCEQSYPGMLEALRGGGAAGYAGTLEFYPEQGKYHLDGHRACGVRFEPAETRAANGRCPVCGRPLTVGVLHRVEELADRAVGRPPPSGAAFQSLVALADLVGELLGRGRATKGVQRVCSELLARVGPELHILRHAPQETLQQAGTELLAEAVLRARRGQVRRDAGYDGEYGAIRVMSPDELCTQDAQLALAGVCSPAARRAARRERPRPRNAGAGTQAPAAAGAGEPEVETAPPDPPHAQPAISDGDVRSPDRVPGDDDLLTALDAEQSAALLRVGDRPLLVVAGPGTGKTRTLSHSVAWTIRHGGADPTSVLAVTFTQQAGAELAARLRGLLGDSAGARVRVGTFHAQCHELLRRHHRAAGLPADFLVLDAEQSLARLRAVAQREGLVPRGGVRALAADWAEIARRRASPGAAARCGPAGGRLEQLLRAYLEQLSSEGAVDFDGLLEQAIEVLAGDLVLRTAEVGALRLVAVDEYQDVNTRQEALLRLWTSGGASLLAIGDPDQAIYGFRGADPRHLLEFSSRWVGAERVRLRRSYRASEAILQASHQALAEVASCAERLQATREGDPHIALFAAPTERAEAEQVVHAVEQAVGGTGFFSLDSGRSLGGRTSLSFGDIAVLYRTHALAAPLVEAFERSGIPFQVSSPAAARDPAGQLVRAALWACQRPCSPAVDVLRRAAEALRSRHVAAAGGNAGVSDVVLAGLVALLQPLAGRPLGELLGPLAVDLAALLHVGASGAAELAAAIARLENDTAGAVPLGVLLSRWALLQEADSRDPRAERVSLMSLHACKGLEFEQVFIVGCEEGLIPFRPRWRDPESVDVAEERRLLYVGMTRARRRLVLSHAARRAQAWPTERSPSPFLADIAAELKRRADSAHRPRDRSAAPDPQLKLL